MDRNRRLVGAAVAAAAAALFVAGTPGTGVAADAVKVKCYGANACKGKAECKTSMNECKGQNACKGKGFVMMDEKACLERFGRG
jgi:hypothetical protein